MPESKTEIRVYFEHQNKKKEIARQLLKSACECYKKGEYFSALHLAGASEEILGEYLQAQGVDNALKSEIEAFKAVGERFHNKKVSDKYAYQFLNKIKNSIKHMDVGIVEQDQADVVGLDWKIVSNKLIDNGWAVRKSSTKVKLKLHKLDLEAKEESIKKEFGDDFLKILPILHKAYDLNDEILKNDPMRESEDVLDRALTNLWRLGEDLTEFEEVWNKI